MIKLQEKNKNKVFYIKDLSGHLYKAKEIQKNNDIIIFKYSKGIFCDLIAYIPINKIVAISENEKQ
jgi:hypothetical protein